MPWEEGSVMDSDALKTIDYASSFGVALLLRPDYDQTNPRPILWGRANNI